MAAASHIRNGSSAASPQMMTNLARTVQQGLLLWDNAGQIDVKLWQRDLAMNPGDPGAYDTYDLSGDATAAAGLNLPINPADNHWMLACGLDALGRIHIPGNSHAHVLWQGSAGQHYIHSTAPWVPGVAPTWTVPAYTSLPWGDNGQVNSCTYNIMARMSDGRLLWFFDQQDVFNFSRGRDWLAFYMPVSGSGWTRLISGTDEFASTNADSPQGVTADRVYVGSVYVEPHGGGVGVDRVWVLINYRTFDEDSSSNTVPCLVYSDDPLTTWRNVEGTAVTMPLTWANRAQCAIPNAPAWGSAGSLTVDRNGNPHVVLQNGTSRGGTLTSIINSDGVTESLMSGATPDGWVHSWHDGTDWQLDRMIGQGSSHPPSLHSVGGKYGADLMLTTADDRMRLATNFSKAGVDRATFAVGGPVNSTEGGETFSILPDPTQLMYGELDLLVADVADPRVFTVGNHARLNAA